VEVSLMRVSDIQTRVKREFGDEESAFISDSDILRWINDAQLDIARKTKTFEVTSQVLSTANTAFYFLPGDFLTMSRVTFEGKTLRFVSREELDQRYPNRDKDYPVGTPEFFHIAKKAIYLYPAPEMTGQVLALTYKQRPTELTLTTEELSVPVEFQLEVLSYCMARAYNMDGQVVVARDHMGAYEKNVIEDKALAQDREDSFPAIRALPGDYGDA
jgi:hypothetical protein